MEFDLSPSPKTLGRSMVSSASVYSNRSTVAATKYKLIVLGESSIGKTSFI